MNKIVYLNDSLHSISDLFKDITERSLKKTIEKIR